MSVERALGIVLFILVIIFLLHLIGGARAEEWEHRGYHHGWEHRGFLPRFEYRDYGHYAPPRNWVCGYDFYGRPVACHWEYR